MFKGRKISLRPITIGEIPIFYKWATQSEGSKFWYGEIYGDELPSFEEFVKDWKPYYFKNTHPEKGRCFFILLNKKPIGVIAYNSVISRRTEIDIIIADKQNQSKGYGPEAIRLLVKYLFEKMKIKEIWVGAINKNPRAISAYKKAGFEVIKTPRFLKKNPYWSKMKLDDWTFLSIKNT